ncbi:MAG: hypothetical protein OXG44_01540 [Gammaproteobacteria bacterium]|nr:hypothetical protein [Gammaproteobacteria bacterium]
MTVDQSRFGGTLETPPEVEEMMAKITDITGCAVILLPADLTAKFKAACEQNGIQPAEAFARVCGGLLTGIDMNVPFALIPIPHVPAASNGEPRH